MAKKVVVVLMFEGYDLIGPKDEPTSWPWDDAVRTDETKFDAIGPVSCIGWSDNPRTIAFLEELQEIRKG